MRGELTGLWDALPLIVQLTRREIAGRYRGSVLGILWSLLTPLFMLAVYTFVFGTVFNARWASAAGAQSSTHTSTHTSTLADPQSISIGAFAVILFAGLIIFQIFSEVVTRAPGLILANQNYVKKIVFPLEILPVVALAASLFHAAVSLLVLIVFELSTFGRIPPTALWLPIVLAPFCLLVLGFAWFLASLGTYVRDVGQILAPLVTALMFISPIFYPPSALPGWLQPWLALNPVALPVTQAREVLIFGRPPDFLALLGYTVAAAAVAYLGYLWFQKTRKGFADVL